VTEEAVRTANVSQARKADLRHDGTKLAACSRDTMCRGSVSGREGLSGYNECGGVGPEVLEEVGHTVKEDEPL